MLPHEYAQMIKLESRISKLERKVAFLLKHLDLDYVEGVRTTDVDPEILDLLTQGKNIDAIKLYREKTGADLKDAMTYIYSLE